MYFVLLILDLALAVFGPALGLNFDQGLDIQFRKNGVYPWTNFLHHAQMEMETENR